LNKNIHEQDTFFMLLKISSGLNNYGHKGCLSEMLFNELTP